MLAPGPHPNGHSGGILPATAERKAAAEQSPLDAPQHIPRIQSQPGHPTAWPALDVNQRQVLQQFAQSIGAGARPR